MSKKMYWTSIISAILIGCAVFVGIVYNNVTNTLETIHEPTIRPTSELRPKKITLEKKDPFSLLLLGVDERENDSGRSDTIIVLTVNPTSESTKILSIPRDTYTEIIGLNKQDKINHAYAFGGMEMALKTVENLLDVPIDYVVQVDMESFLEIVDIMGGVTVENQFAFQVDDFIYEKGQVHLTGEEALSYVRMRMDDPQGDFGRQARQKQVIQAILKEGASINSLLNYKELLGSFEKNIRTNMTADQMIDIQKRYKNALDQVDSLAFSNGEGSTINGIWYYMLDQQELQNISKEMKNHLDLE